MTEHLKETLAVNFPELPARFHDMAEDTVRSSSLADKIRQTREEAGLTLKDVAARLKVPQYRLRDAETSPLRGIVPGIFQKYVAFLGIGEWVEQWIKANQELADRLGISGPRRA